MTNTKTTNKTALQYALDHLTDAPADIREKWEKMIVQLEKKSGGERKPTKTQIANEKVRAAVVKFINENMEGDGFTVSDLLKICPAVEGRSNQYVSSILKQAVDAYELSKHTVKRRSYFIPYDPKLVEVEG